MRNGSELKKGETWPTALPEGDAVAQAREVPRGDPEGTGMEERSTAWRRGIVP